MTSTAVKIIYNWAQTISQRNPQRQASLYSADGVLIPTLDNNILIGRKNIMPYFIDFLNKENLVCNIISVHEQKTRSGISILSGIYEFVYTESGLKKNVRARYSFVVYNNFILNQHSSLEV